MPTTHTRAAAPKPLDCLLRATYYLCVGVCMPL